MYTYLIAFRITPASNHSYWTRFYIDDEIARVNATNAIMSEYPNACDIVITNVGKYS